LGEAVSLGETANGIVASSHEEHTPVDGAPTAELEIDVLAVMSTVKVLLTNGAPPVPLGELVRDALAAVTDGFRRGLQPGIRQPNDGAGSALGERGGE
jgi:hypothetical protein